MIPKEYYPNTIEIFYSILELKNMAFTYFKIAKNVIVEALEKGEKHWLKNLYSQENSVDKSLFVTEFSKNFLLQNKSIAAKIGQKDFKAVIQTEDEVEKSFTRLRISVEASLEDPIPSNLLDELKLILLLNPKIILTYTGRHDNAVSTQSIGHQKEIINFRFMTKLCIDIVNGRQLYMFDLRNPKKEQDDLFQRFHYIKCWFDDPDTKIILSLGGGGCRMFAIPTLLKIIDMLGVRDQIDEIWGSSGGSFIGNLYASGASPQQIELVGRNFHKDQYDLPSKKTKLKTAFKVAKKFVESSRRFLDLSKGLTQIQASFEAIYQDLRHRNHHFDPKKNPSIQRMPSVRKLKDIPFYCVATQLNDDSFCALTEEKNIRPWTKEMLVACDPVTSMCASSAIPFVLPSQSVKSNYDQWIDGMFTEEIPMFLPVLKHMKEKENDPRYPYKKVKIFYVDLGARLDELSIFQYFFCNIKKFG
ncbi:patatin-like phospholipase family protein, partial [Bacteriovoracaceae bacterium]|nr:patatin-like phospholipase family protein [Bacteriovoracaceae bacterium]